MKVAVGSQAGAIGKKRGARVPKSVVGVGNERTRPGPKRDAHEELAPHRAEEHGTKRSGLPDSPNFGMHNIEWPRRNGHQPLDGDWNPP
jgi:hypothetical protein